MLLVTFIPALPKKRLCVFCLLVFLFYLVFMQVTVSVEVVQGRNMNAFFLFRTFHNVAVTLQSKSFLRNLM